MPCDDGGYYSGKAAVVESLDRQHRAEVKKLKDRNDKLARLLCEAMHLLKDGKSQASGTNELRHWWREHKSWDKQRKDKR